MAGNVTDMTKQDSNKTDNKTVAGQIVGYARVSSAGQNLDRQLDVLRNVGCQKIFQEKTSGTARDREQLRAALTYLRDGDVLVCTSMDRLARSLPDLDSIVNELTERGVTVKFLKEAQSYSQDSDAVSNLMLALLGAVAEFERSLIKERQSEGIAKARERGAYKGRSASLDEWQIQKLCDIAKVGVPKSKIAEQMGISRATVYRYLSIYQG